VGTAPAWALVRISDEGLGIPASEVPHVFERYRQATGRARRVRGSGLGLYTCRAIVEAHGGHIWVERTTVAPDLGQRDQEQQVASHVASVDAKTGDWHGTVLLLALPGATLEPLNAG
jgi:signal transduction histidine kinase